MGNINYMISILNNSINDVFRIHYIYITAVLRICSGMEGKVNLIFFIYRGYHLANSHNITLNPITVFTDSKSLQMVEQIDGKVEHRTSRSEKSPGYMSNYMDWNIQWCESIKALLFHMYNLRGPNSLFLYKAVRAEISKPTPPPPHLNGVISESGRHTFGHIPFFSYCIAKH